MSQTRITIIKEVKEKLVGDRFGETICLQQCVYDYGDGSNSGVVYRVIKRDTEGRLLPQRGQAAIPSLDVLERLIQRMS